MITEEEHNYFLNLKEGDEVGVKLAYDKCKIAYVKRLTKTMIILNNDYYPDKEGDRFFKDRLYEVGASTWSRSRLIYPSKEFRDKIYYTTKLNKLTNLFRYKDFSKFNIEQIEFLINYLEDKEIKSNEEKKE